MRWLGRHAIRKRERESARRELNRSGAVLNHELDKLPKDAADHVLTHIGSVTIYRGHLDDLEVIAVLGLIEDDLLPYPDALAAWHAFFSAQEAWQSFLS